MPYADKAKTRACIADWRDRNRDKMRQYSKDHYEKNKHRYRMKHKEWKRGLRRAIPVWADREAMFETYRIARWFRRNGVPCHVDHVIPIKGKNVCGLHVENNLEIIPASENDAKGNRHEGY